VRERGFTALEILVATVLFAVLLAGVSSALATDSQTSRLLLAHFGPEMRLGSALERICTDLRMAGEWGEDRNHDGAMQDGEDTNGNGILDADWSLADGTAGQSSITFNRRLDLTDADGNLMVSGIFSRAVTYRISGTDLVREWRRTLPGGGVLPIRSTVASDVLALRFSRVGQLVTVELEVRLPESISRTGQRTATERVWLRN